MKKGFLIFLIVVLALGVLTMIPMLWGLAKTNYLALQTSEALLALEESSIPEMVSFDACRDHWLRGLLYHGAGELNERNPAWVQAGSCNMRYIVFMHRLLPMDQPLALSVNQVVPGSAEAWFWLGDLMPEHAVEYYQRGLELDPDDAHRWMTLAGLLEFEDPQASLEALVKACELGDPGENACLYAGGRYVSLGDVQSAINIMRKATWQGTLERADRLEMELKAEK